MAPYKNAVPDRWPDYSDHGDVVPGTRFVAFKAPLRVAICSVLPDKRFTPERLLEKVQSLGLVINLTNTDRYYDPQSIVSHGVAHAKIMCPGARVPNTKIVKSFSDIVGTFVGRPENDGKLMRDHCTHGVNRTGYVVCRYMVDKLGIAPAKAIEDFQKARRHNFDRQEYVGDLRGRALKKSLKTFSDNVKNWRPGCHRSKSSSETWNSFGREWTSTCFCFTGTKTTHLQATFGQISTNRWPGTSRNQFFQRAAILQSSSFQLSYFATRRLVQRPVYYKIASSALQLSRSIGFGTNARFWRCDLLLQIRALVEEWCPLLAVEKDRHNPESSVQPSRSFQRSSNRWQLGPAGRDRSDGVDVIDPALLSFCGTKEFDSSPVSSVCSPSCFKSPLHFIVPPGLVPSPFPTLGRTSCFCLMGQRFEIYSSYVTRGE
ncbi:hypothetical protein HPB51_008128 [Rhipicephalus microplus]|uniref:Tyrosine specific protein phosphatases domain-containing protein n=1 Tax=Rhipicephalus microplus TaxID=6941 RepID=A0A9J6D9J3_RHIMP|nr:hypothetical protein HPB51_008128 [Rhipicephalus microplus]